VLSEQTVNKPSSDSGYTLLLSPYTRRTSVCRLLTRVNCQVPVGHQLRNSEKYGLVHGLWVRHRSQLVLSASSSIPVLWGNVYVKTWPAYTRDGYSNTFK